MLDYRGSLNTANQPRMPPAHVKLNIALTNSPSPTERMIPLIPPNIYHL